MLTFPAFYAHVHLKSNSPKLVKTASSSTFSLLSTLLTTNGIFANIVLPLKAGLLIEIETIEEERAVLGIEDPAKRLGCPSILSGIEDVGDIQIPSADDIPNVSVVGKKVLIPYPATAFDPSR